MPESFGAQLRQRRERQQVALATIAEQTKIKVSLLEALERDDVSHWPSGIFRRAFIRAYADAIGLAPDVVVREFLEHYPDPLEEVAMESALSVVATAGDAASFGAGPPTRFRYLVGSAIDALSRLSPGIVPKRGSPLEDLAAANGTPVKALAALGEGSARRDNGVEREPLIEEHAPTGSSADQTREELHQAVPARPEPDLLAAAQLCTELGRVEETRDAAPLLEEAAKILDAVGLIAWVWDPLATELTPALAHGYSDQVLARLPRVWRDTNNATARAFRSAQPCVVEGSDETNGALVVPLMTPMGCVGVLAVELQPGRVQKGSVRALVTIFAAQLARLVGASRPAQAVDRRLA